MDEEKRIYDYEFMGKWDDIKWYWDEYLDLLVVSENRNNGQIGIDGW